MSTERVIDELVADLRPVRARSMLREGLILALLGAAELGAYLILGYARPDIHLAMTLPSFWWKLGSLALLSVLAAATALRSFHPMDSPRGGLRLLGLVIAGSLIVGWLIDGSVPARGGLIARLMWRHGLDCVVAMTTLSIPAIVALGLLMRRGASTELNGSALAVGVAGAAWGAFVFVFACPHDDPLYIAVWYVVGCSIVTAAGRLILPRVARW